MCTARSVFFYGVFVKSAYLCFASDAYKEAKDSLLGIDLICARRRRGNLAAKQGADSMTKIPEEVWKMIKGEIGGIAMLEAEQNLVNDFYGYHSWEEGEGERKGLRRWGEGMMNDGAFDDFHRNGGMHEMLSERSMDMAALLEDFGLALPLREPYSQEESPEYDVDSLSAISLPLDIPASPDHDNFPATYAEASPDYGPTHESVKYSKETFALPSDADRRIKSFLSFFNLEAMDPERMTVYPRRIKAGSSTSSAQSDIGKTKKEAELAGNANHESTCCRAASVEPHWQMWTIARCYG